VAAGTHHGNILEDHRSREGDDAHIDLDRWRSVEVLCRFDGRNDKALDGPSLRMASLGQENAMAALVLIAEDDDEIASILDAYLQREGSGPYLPATAVPPSISISL
jgi:hypothetical protein